MKVDEFNEKYKNYLEEGHYGLDISDESVIKYLDDKFQELIKIEGFSYSQIKLKFNMARVYIQPNSIDSYDIEENINKLLK